MTTPYATAEEVREQMAGKESDAQDDVIDKIVLAVSEAIDRYCNREQDGFVAPGTASAREFGGSGSMAQYIHECIAVTKVETRYTFTDSYVTWATGDYQPYSGSLQVPNFTRTPYMALMATGVTYAKFPRGGLPLVRVTAKWGFAATVPATVKEACVMEASRFFKRSESAFADTLADGNFGILMYKKKLDPDVQFLLDTPGLRRVAL